MQMGNCCVWLLLAVGCPGVLGCSDSAVGEASGSLEQGLFYGADDRQAMTEASFSTWPHLRAVGWLETTVGCTATLVAANTLLTATHCIPQGFAPSDILFHPAFVGVPNSGDEATHPSVRASSWFNATANSAGLEKFFGYVPGNDWAIIHLDPSTYQRGSASYPATLAEFPTLPVNLLTFPIQSAGVDTTHIGYSADFFTANNAGFRSTGKLRVDGICSTDAGQRSEGPGVVLSDVERNGGSSGGPLFTNAFTAGSTAILATVGGGQEGSAPSWTQSNANKEVSSAGFAFAPWQANGLAFTNDPNGQRWAFAADSTFFNGLRFTAGQNTTYPHYPASNWFDFRDAGTTPVAQVFRRMAAATTSDGHMWVATLDGTGQVWNKVASAGTTFGTWRTWFPGSAVGGNARGVALASSAPTTIRMWVLHNDCTVEVRRKTGAWNGSWTATQQLGSAGANCQGIAVATTGGFQQAFVSTSSGIVTQWETGSATWSGWFNFADGLPADLVPIDVAAGTETASRMMVVLLGHRGADTVIYYRRKSTSATGSAWDPWNSYASSGSGVTFSELKDATQIAFAPTNSQSVNLFTSIFFISKGGGMYTPAYKNGSFVNFAPYYAPYTPNPLPSGPGVPPCL